MSGSKERASILWLLSKACRKDVPEELRDPYYVDQNGRPALKPAIVQGLASCELYSLALSCIYEDPNYAVLNHTGVIQLLIRKGVQLIEPHLSSLTETILLQNAPIRLNAHLLVIDALQALFVKDILIPEQVVDVVSRFLHFPVDEVPLTVEEVALFWVNKCCARFKQLVDDELGRTDAESIQYVPVIPPMRDLFDLNSGRQLLGLISFYCPDYVTWSEICLREQLTEEEALTNLETLQYFCSQYLPYDICFLNTEDWLRPCHNLKLNILTFLADLMFLFEIKPASCVRRPGPELLLDQASQLQQQEQLQQQQQLLKEQQLAEQQFMEQQLTDEQQRKINNHLSQSMVTIDRNRSVNLSASEMKARSLRHTSWIEDDAQSDHFIQQQQKLEKYFQPHKHLRQEIHQSLRDDLSLHSASTNTIAKRKASSRQKLTEHELYDLSSGLNSLNLDSPIRDQQAAELMYAADHGFSIHQLQNNNTSHEHSGGSPISFATLSKENDLTGSSQKENHNQLNQLNQLANRSVIRVAYSNETNDSDQSLKGVETEMGGQIMEIRLKLEEKRRQIEQGKKQQEDRWKSQRQGISKEAFLKALKKDTVSKSSSMLFNSSSDSRKKISTESNQLDEHKDDFENSLSNNKSSVMSTSKHDLVRSPDTNGSQFFLHQNDQAVDDDEYLLNQINHHQQNQQTSSPPDLAKRFQDYYTLQQKQQQQQQMQKMQHSHHETNNNGDHKHEGEEKVSNNNNNEKGFFILLDDEPKKPKPMPPQLRSKLLAQQQQSNNNGNKLGQGDVVDQTSTLAAAKLPKTPAKSIGFVIGIDLVDPDPMDEIEKAKKKEQIVIQSLRRRAQQETQRMIKEDELAKKRELERKKQEFSEKKKELSRQKREAILEQHKLRKMQESDKDGKTDSKLSLLMNAKSEATLRNRSASSLKGRPKSIHVSNNIPPSSLLSLESFRSSKANLVSDHLDAAFNFQSVNYSSNYSTLRPTSSLSTNSVALKKLASGTLTSTKHTLPSLPPFLISNKLHRGSGSSDGVSDIGSSYSEYTGPKLYVKPTQKSNRGIIINAVNVVLGGAVNGQTKKKVLEEINNNDSKHFLILFRGAGMQFRALYSYNPELEEIVKLHGTGPKSVNNDMIDKFYKYNSGSKNFNEVHTKHLTVTIDAFTIHNMLWTGKRMPPPKKDPF